MTGPAHHGGTTMQPLIAYDIARQRHAELIAAAERDRMIATADRHSRPPPHPRVSLVWARLRSVEGRGAEVATAQNAHGSHQIADALERSNARRVPRSNCPLLDSRSFALREPSAVFSRGRRAGPRVPSCGH
jgi:hypothetical protein